MREKVDESYELLNFINNNPTSNTKVFYPLGTFGQQEANTIAKLLNINELNFELIIDSDAVRHTVAQHGPMNSHFEALRGQIPIQKDDILGLADWLPTATNIAAGQAKPGKPPRVEVIQATSAGTTVVILEWRAGRQQLALVTMYKKRSVA